MSEMCAVAIGNLVENARCLGDDVRLEIARESGVGEGWAGCTPEQLYLVLRLDKILHDLPSWAELVNEKWSDGDGGIITSSRLPSLTAILEVGRGSKCMGPGFQMYGARVPNIWGWVPNV